MQFNGTHGLYRNSVCFFSIPLKTNSKKTDDILESGR